MGALTRINVPPPCDVSFVGGAPHPKIPPPKQNYKLQPARISKVQNCRFLTYDGGCPPTHSYPANFCNSKMIASLNLVGAVSLHVEAGRLTPLTMRPAQFRIPGYHFFIILGRGGGRPLSFTKAPPTFKIPIRQNYTISEFWGGAPPPINAGPPRL